MAPIRAALGYSGSSVVWVETNVYASLCGNSIRIEDFATQKQKILVGEGRGISCFATDAKHGLIAYAEKAQRPKIFLHKLDGTSFRHLATLQSEAKLEVTALAISSNGERLVTVSGEPELKLSVWNWEQGVVLCEEMVPQQAEHVSFHPMSADTLCSSGSGCMNLWEMDKQHDAIVLKGTEVAVPGVAPNVHAWCPLGDTIYAGCLGGEIILLNSKTGEPVLSRTTPEKDLLPVMAHLSDEGPAAIRSLSLNREALVAAGDTPFLRWWLHPTELGCPLGEANDVDCGVRGTSSLCMGGPLCNQLLAGSQEASIHVMELPPAGGGEVEPTCLGDYHLGRITAVAPLSDGTSFATCGEDGTLRIWDMSSCSLVGKRQFSTVQNCLATNENTMCLAMGSESGVVRVVNSKDLKNLSIPFCNKLHKGGVTSVAFSPSASMLMSYAEDKRMFFCTVVGGVVRVLGFLNPPGPLLDLGWAGTDDSSSMIVASMPTGELMGISPPDYEVIVSSKLQFGPKDYTIRRVKVDGVINKLSVIAGLEAPQVIGFGEDRLLRKYQLRREATFWGGISGRTQQPDAKVSLLDKPAGGLCAARGGGYLAMAGQDGSVQVHSSDLAGPQPVVSITPHDSLLGGATAVAISQTGSEVLSAGIDGSIFISEALPEMAALPRPPVPDIGDTYDVETPDDMQQLDEIETRAKNEADKLHRDTEGDREAVRNALTSLRKIFADCWERNTKAPDLEQLSRQEFIVDKEMCLKLQAEGLQKVRMIQAGIQKETLSMQLLREQILNSTHELMDTKAGVVVGMKNSYLTVSNFTLPLPDNNSWKLDKALMLRRVEMKQQRQQFFVKGDLAYRVEFDEEGKPIHSKKLAQLEIQDEEMLNDAATAAAIDSKDVRDLMYSDLDLHCITRKCTQYLIIQRLIRETKEKFNVEFSEMMKRKVKDTDKVADLNARIDERARELHKMTGDDVALEEELASLFHVSTEDERERDDIKFGVTDSEIPVEKYVSPKDEERRRKELKEEEERQKKAAGDNSVQRALTMMMGGTLERPDDGVAEFKVDLPDWMDNNPKTWSDEQFKEAKEYEAKQKAAVEEMTKKIQTVETELRTLKVSVEETCAKFDEALDALATQKMSIASDIYQMEFRAIRMLQAVEDANTFSDMSEHKMLVNIEDMKSKKDKGTALLTDIRRKVEQQREKVEAIMADEKALEKSFKKDFAETEGHLTALFHLFKRRTLKHSNVIQAANLRAASQSGLGMESAVHSSAALEEEDEDEDSLDPFPQAGRSGGREHEPPLDPAQDRPAGVDDYWWNQFVRVRQAKLDLEAEVRAEAEVLLNMQRYLQKLSIEDEQLRHDITESNEAAEEFRHAKGRQQLNLELPMRLRQGQVEAEPPSDTVSDMGHAVLLHRKHVMDINSVIKGKGGKKVSILTAIKDFKKGSYELEWTSRKLDREAEDLVEKTKELQLLRVTKGLQEVLKRGAEAQASPQEQTNLEVLMRHNGLLHQKNVMEKQRKLQKLNLTCKEKQLQNYECTLQIEEMETKLGEQARISQSQKAGGLSTAKRMKSMVTHKKLKDIAAAQTAEIQMLRAEVERLNLRTYPSFVEQSSYYPDELA